LRDIIYFYPAEQQDRKADEKSTPGFILYNSRSNTSIKLRWNCTIILRNTQRSGGRGR
jgi:hypothetical protein